MKEEYIFVYGTLRKTQKKHPLLCEHTQFIENATFCGKLYLIQDYPAVVFSENLNDKVIGEVYQLLAIDKAFLVLDEYEEVGEQFPSPNEYFRKQMPIILDSGKPLTAWVYMYNHSLENKPYLTSGDFLNP